MKSQPSRLSPRRTLLLAAACIACACALVVIAQPREPMPSRYRRQRTAAAANAHNEVHMDERDGYRYIESNGIADHPTGQFPNRGNPNTIEPQHYLFRVTLHPTPAEHLVPLEHQLFGVALNGVPFDPGTAEFWNNDPRLGWNYEAMTGHINLGLDQNHAHVQPSGAYHYHGLPTGLVEEHEHDHEHAPPVHMILVGYAADGYPMYAQFGHADAGDPHSPLKELQSSYRLKPGQRPGSPDGPGGKYDGTFTQDFEYVQGAGDLDECNGRTGVTPEYPQGTYYYVLTDTFPFVPRFFRGTPDSSFQHHGPPGIPAGRGGMRGGRPGPGGRDPFGGPPGGPGQ